MDAQDIVESLEDSGLRCTPQRFSVMSFLLGHPGHPTSAEIFEGVNRLDPRSSRATIYNNLRDLVKVGLVREVAVEGRAARFDVKGMRHHHFICDRCGSVEDVEWYNVPKPAAASLGKRVVYQVELIVRGLCIKCASPPGSKSTSSQPSQRFTTNTSSISKTTTARMTHPRKQGAKNVE